MKTFIFILIGAAVIIAAGVFVMSGSASATEKPDYKVIDSDGAFEIREYPPMLLAEVTVEGDRKTANSRGFRKLAAFIFGDNVSQSKVAMTSPVVSQPVSEEIAMTSPVVGTPNEDGRWTVNFMMPSKYTMATLPKPTDPDIRVFESEPYRTVSIRYNGTNSAKNVARHEEELRSYIAETDLIVEPTPQYMGYDAPWVPGPMRRNEVQFKLVD